MKYGLPHTTRKAVPNTGETDMISISAYTTDAWFMSSEFYTEEEIRSKFGMKPFLVPYPTNQESPEELTKDLNEQEKEWYKHKNDLNTQSVFDWFPLEGIGKFCFRCPSADLLRTIEEEIKDTYKDRVSVAFSSSNTLDVMKGGVSKATAIGEVLELINPAETNPIQLSEVVAFGDSMNDKEMLAVAGVGYLMSNAQPRLKEELKDNPTCRETEVTNEEDGVANALLALFNAEE
ncbi:haloacid dehalogenase-like hydrolase/Sucrose-6F-phosphate phosphohydrolase, putative [Angomonas deanei]|uniref:Haloacid dehalogenase-like hydrolase/Sucrose-6F-phosphate phosphohydrolase, putative n=1 Tax=Angomonas deanei TaxID=59799 RepID=A0A7G2CG80_9TRYP|nr:haloacid dehalogenase-like hydrolase/Sucrose-6F-phosphate phosphohydrolase, putative [Angomonas deanei]